MTQARTNTDVPPTSKENTKNKSDIENECNTICRESTDEKTKMKNINLKQN